MRINDSDFGNFNISKETLAQAHSVKSGVHTYTITAQGKPTEIKANDLMKLINDNRTFLTSKECKDLKGIIKKQSGLLEKSDYKIKLSILNIADFRNIRSFNKVAGQALEQNQSISELMNQFDNTNDIRKKITIMGKLENLAASQQGLRSKIDAKKDDMSIINLNRAVYAVSNINSQPRGVESIAKKREILRKEVNEMARGGNLANVEDLVKYEGGAKPNLEYAKALMVLVKESGLFDTATGDYGPINNSADVERKINELDRKIDQLIIDPFVSKMNEFSIKYDDLFDQLHNCTDQDGSVNQEKLKDILNAEKELDKLLDQAVNSWEGIDKKSEVFGENDINEFKTEVEEAKKDYKDKKEQINNLVVDSFVQQVNKFSEKHDQLCDLIAGCIDGKGEVAVTSRQLDLIGIAERNLSKLLEQSQESWKNIEERSGVLEEGEMSEYKNELDDAISALKGIKEDINVLREEVT